jgi:ubiquinone/menaquinone biosynthesis C-methylase UbiE
MTHKHPAGWDDIAAWYDGWVGEAGSHFHRHVAIPAILNLLTLQPDQHILDVGAGTGVLAKAVHDAGAQYTGIDISPRLIQQAKQYHGAYGHFMLGDARQLRRVVGAGEYDACAYLLSIQDMNPLKSVLESAAYALRGGGVVAILMTHPCFRIPRQSGWGYEDQKKLQYRRIDRYLTPLNIPMKKHKRGTTISFHRPISAYINALAAHGLLVDKLDEITTYQRGENRAEQRANDEIPLFMGLRARKL